MFWAPKFLGEAPPPQFLEWDYKIQPDYDYVAKFQGDRSRELGERFFGRHKFLGAGSLKIVPKFITPALRGVD